MRAHVGYESRLELAWLLLADCDPGWDVIVSQPFQLVARVDGQSRRHVPDFLAVRADGLVSVVDVKPGRLLDDPVVVSTLAWTRVLAEAQGWAFEVFSEPDPVQLANVRFLAGYRRAWQFDAGLLDRAVGALARPVSFGEAAEGLAGSAGRARARGHLLHLLWSGRVRCGLSLPLSESTLVEAR
jgi:hypothetical protein